MPTNSSNVIQYWWVTASDKNRVHPWHWRQFFEDSDNPAQRYDWGGPDWINSWVSFARIREMRAGDVVVAYQADEGVVGLVYLASPGYQHFDEGNYDTFDLASTPHAWLTQPVPYQVIRDLPGARKHIEFVGAKVKRGTVFRISPTGFKMILRLILDFNPNHRGEVGDFLIHSQRSSNASSLAGSREAEVVAVDETDLLITPPKSKSTIQRIIRDCATAKSLKRLYQYRCQVCGTTIELPDGTRYAEVHHLRPVGRPHNGQDGKPNTIVVCPHHHAIFDLGIVAINPDTLAIEHWNPDADDHGLRLILKHELDKASLNYHFKKIFRGVRG